jgi:hypothetical protein
VRALKNRIRKSRNVAALLRRHVVASSPPHRPVLSSLICAPCVTCDGLVSSAIAFICWQQQRKRLQLGLCYAQASRCVPKALAHSLAVGGMHVEMPAMKRTDLSCYSGV